MLLRTPIMKTTLVAATAVAMALFTAGTASAQDVRISFGDLDLASSEGAAQFDRRVNRASRRACNGGSPLATAACVARFRTEAQTLLPEVRRDEYARGRAGRDVARAPASEG